MSCFLTNSSVGKKLVMSITGCFLVLFILFHMSMNLAMLFSPSAYDAICRFLGANWYALAATVVLAAGVAVHFIYAFILTVDNYRARGKQRYQVTVQEKGVSWASKNMLVLGVIVILGLGLHLIHFWSKMQLVEIMGHHASVVGGYEVGATQGAALMMITFSKWYNVVLYIVWFAAIWFHLTHGVWSMFQTAGFANDTWYPRLKCLANIVATLLFLGFAVVAVYCFLTSTPQLIESLLIA
ncbi:MAG: succinate dehydrogenase cytochrome b subunit [Alistipes sp.]|nr:succinate dehydrogenase cytochrome b subunit [Alistipes sp.]MBR5585051.1 succinate dehydrogenase cytochrome b subunit [Alistipes sp.]MBR6545201.1 succinate dehydrogenase cytochrome b subunit [Alistipes sp.]